MHQLYCYNHRPEPVEMNLFRLDPTDKPGYLFICPRCNTTVSLLPDRGMLTEHDWQSFDRLIELSSGQGLSREGRVFYTSEVESSEYIQFPELRQFLDEYVKRYEAAAIDPFIELWAEDATQEVLSGEGNLARRDTSREAIILSYNRLFDRAKRMYYRLVVTGLQADPASFQVEGSYRIDYTAGPGQTHRYEGMISFGLARRPGHPLEIKLLRFQPTTFT